MENYALDLNQISEIELITDGMFGKQREKQANAERERERVRRS